MDTDESNETKKPSEKMQELWRIQDLVWKGSGVHVSYEEVLAAKAVLEEFIATLDDSKYAEEKRQALDLSASMARVASHKMSPEVAAEERRKEIEGGGYFSRRF